MDEIKDGFNPIDEYAPIEQDINTQQTPDADTSSVEENANGDLQGAEENTDVFEERNNEAEQSTTENAQEAFQTPPVQAQPAQIPPVNTPPYYQQGYPYTPYPPQQPTQQRGAYSQPYQQPQYPAQPQYNQPPYYTGNTGAYQRPAQPSPYANNQQPQYAQAPNQNPYAQQRQNPYTSQNPYAQQPVTNQQKPKTPKGTKILIGVLIGLLVLFMLGFFVSCSALIFGNGSDNNTSKNPLSEFAQEPTYDYFDDSFDDYYSFDLGPSYNGDTFKEDIILQSDEGQTQEKDGDKSSYPPDKDAKGVEFEKLPKDKGNKKYTTQSAYNEVCDSVVGIVCYEDKITDDPYDIISEGTGTIISEDGYIITNSHVICDSKAYTINVIFNNAEEYTAKVVGYDTRTDLAVIKIDAKDLKYVKFSDSSKVEVGQDIVAVGNPGGTSFQNSLTKGIVSAVDRELQLSANVKYIQIDAAINPGNSGGPLCNIYGQVIGINTAKIALESYEGMGFAIESNLVSEIANDLIKYGYVKGRVRLGLMGREVDEEMAYSYNLPYGVLITEIDEDGPLYDTKIQEYDIITEIDGKEVSTFQEIFAILEEHKEGDEVTLTLYRLEY